MKVKFLINVLTTVLLFSILITMFACEDPIDRSNNTTETPETPSSPSELDGPNYPNRPAHPDIPNYPERPAHLPYRPDRPRESTATN